MPPSYIYQWEIFHAEFMNKSKHLKSKFHFQCSFTITFITVFAGVKAAVFLEEKYQKVGVQPLRRKCKKKKKTKVKTPTRICAYGTRNSKITIPLWYRTFLNILPTILSCIVDMKTKINVLTQHLLIDLDLRLCQCIAKVKEWTV